MSSKTNESSGHHVEAEKFQNGMYILIGLLSNIRDTVIISHSVLKKFFSNVLNNHNLTFTLL